MTLKQIEKITKSKIKRKEIPTIDDIFQSKYNNMLTRIKATLDENDHKQYIPLATELDEEYNLVDVAAALIKMMFDKELTFDYSENSINPPASSASVRLFVSAGKKDRINPKSLIEFFVETADINKNEIGDIDILENFSFINVPERIAEILLKKSSGKKIGPRRVNLEVANSKRR